MKTGVLAGKLETKYNVTYMEMNGDTFHSIVMLLNQLLSWNKISIMTNNIGFVITATNIFLQMFFIIDQHFADR